MANAIEQRGNKGKWETRWTSALWALEPRYMFDAAGVAATVDVAADQVAQQQADQAVPAEQAEVADAGNDGIAVVPGAATNEQAQLLSALSDYQAPGDRREIVFVDSRVKDYQTLIGGINPSAQVVVLGANRDGVLQIAEVVSQYERVDAVHLIADGDQGSVKLGAGVLDLNSMQGQYAQTLGLLGEHLAPDADILVYGCNFGAGDAGQLAAGALAALTGADIAASTDPTGHASLGGDWELELNYGSVEALVALNVETQHHWNHLLGTTLVWSTTDGPDANLNPDFPITRGGVTITNTISGDPITTANYNVVNAALNAGGQGTTLQLEQNASNNSQVTQYTLTFSAPVSGLAFILADVDSNIPGNQPFQDRVVINGTLAGGPPVTLTAGVDVTFNPAFVQSVGTNTVQGIVNNNPDSDPFGNVTVAFPSPIDQLTLIYGNDPSLPVFNPSTQFIFISNMFWNRAPTAVNDTYVTPANTALTAPPAATLTNNDTDPDGDALTVNTTPVVNVTNGALTLNANGTFTYTPNAGFNGLDTFTYEISDGSGGTATAIVTINVGNSPPVNSVPGAQTVLEEASIGIAGVSVNDINDNLATTQLTVTNGTITVNLAGGATISAGANGSNTLTLSGTLAQINAALGTITYQGNANVSGAAADTLTVLSTDVPGLTDTDPVTIDITAINDAPAGTDNTVALAQDTPYTFAAADFGFTDPSDTPANALQAVIINTLPPVGDGALTIGGVPVVIGVNNVIPAAQIGTLVFTPVLGRTGAGVGGVTFQVQDDGGTANGGVDTDPVANNFAFNIAANVAPLNTVPGAQTVAQDTSLAIAGVSVNDANGNLASSRLTVLNGTLTVSLAGGASISAGANGSSTLTLSGTQAQINAALATLAYQGNLNFNGADTLTVLSTDALGASDTDPVAITVTATAGGPLIIGGVVDTVPDNLLHAHDPRGPGIAEPRQPFEPAPPGPARLPVTDAVQGIADLGSVVSVGPQLMHPISHEVERLNQLEFFDDQINSPDFRLPNIGLRPDLPIMSEVARIGQLDFFGDRLGRATDNNRVSSWDVDGLGHSVTFVPREAQGRAGANLAEHHLTVHTTMMGSLLYIKIEHTQDMHAQFDVVKFTVLLANGQPLPNWLSVDPDSGLLSGVPPVGHERLQLKVQAQLRDGQVLSGYVEIEPDTGSITELEQLSSAEAAVGAARFSDQLAQAAQRFDSDLARLRGALGG